MKTTLVMCSVALATLVCLASPARASLLITEAMTAEGPGATNDWWELTNFSASAVSIVGDQMDDGSFTFANSVPLQGVTSIGPGESVVFLESTSGDPVTEVADFRTFWGGLAGVQVGYYSGSGLSLSGSGDGVIVFDSGGATIDSVSFGATVTGQSFGYNPTTMTFGEPSVAGVHGAFDAATVTANQNVGSPGAVPEPSSIVLAGFGLAGLGLSIIRRRNRRIGVR